MALDRRGPGRDGRRGRPALEEGRDRQRGLPVTRDARGKGEAKELRLAAAKCGADVLFVIHGAAQTDSYKNAAAVFNLTVVGGYIVPGSHRDSLFMMEGCLLDVDNGYIYTGVQTEGVGKIIRPTFVIEDKDAVAARQDEGDRRSSATRC